MPRMLLLAIFALMIGALLLARKGKVGLVCCGFVILSAAYVAQHGLPDYLGQFTTNDRWQLLFDIALVLPGLAVVMNSFEKSGITGIIARLLPSDALLLASVFVLSTFLDNIVAAMIGGSLLLARYGKNKVPFPMLVAVIASSNLGGAPSPIGDTTTLMLYMSRSPLISGVDLMKGFVAAIPAEAVLIWWATRSSQRARPAVDMPLSAGSVRWKLLGPMLAIPGLVVGNVFHQAGIGLWATLLPCVAAGCCPEWPRTLRNALPSALLLLALVASADLLPMHQLVPLISAVNRDVQAVVLGLFFFWLNNVPLTAIALRIGGFDWGLLSYCVGFGGSTIWFGSSAGIALGELFPEVYESRRWVVPFFVVSGIYLVGVAAYFLVFSWV